MTPLGPWRGQYTDGQTAQVHDVKIQLDVAGLHVSRTETGEPLTDWALGQLVIDASFKGLIRVSSTGAPNAGVDVADPTFHKALVEAGALPRVWRPGVLLTSLVAGVAVVVSVISLTIDPFAQSVAQRVPMSVEYKVKDKFAEHFGKDRCSTPGSDAALAALEGRLAGAKEPIDFDIRISSDSMVNAFALPGGVIFLTKGLLHSASGPDEVAGVLAHEMEHIRRRHIMASIVRTAILTGVWQVAVGDFTGLLVVDPTTAYQVATLKFDRDAEAQADAGAIKSLDRAGISREGFKQFFSRLKEDDGPGIPDLISSHPGHDRRLEMIDAGKGAKNPQAALTEAQWQDLRTACGPVPAADEEDED